MGGQRQWQQRHLEGSRGCPRGVPTQRHSAAGGAGMAVPSTQWWFWDGAESRVLPPGDASPAPSPPPPHSPDTAQQRPSAKWIAIPSPCETKSLARASLPALPAELGYPSGLATARD